MASQANLRHYAQCSSLQSPCAVTKNHPDHTITLTRLKRIQGQLSGIERMIFEQRYCVDILVQFRAVRSALKGIEKIIFEKHVRTCVKNAMETKNHLEIENKIDELMDLLFKKSHKGDL